MQTEHGIEPVFDTGSNILILGSFPSVRSREQGFFYGHPRNRFWKVIAAVTESEVPETIEEKKRLLLEKHIAVWDVIARCDIHGSSDASIKNAEPNDIGLILNTARIRGIFCNGTKSFELYEKYIEPYINIKAVKLPSTSPANAAWNLERLIAKWKEELQL